MCEGVVFGAAGLGVVGLHGQTAGALDPKDLVFDGEFADVGVVQGLRSGCVEVDVVAVPESLEVGAGLA